MAYAEITRNSKSSLRKFSHQRRFQIALKLIDLKPNETLLDFGTGDGYFLQCINKLHPNAKLVGFDPMDFMFEELQETIKNNRLNNIQITNKLDRIEPKSFQVISCLEVLEHFSKEEQKERLLEIIDKLDNHGRIIVSVPLEIGFPSLFKNSFRYITRQSKEDATLKNIVKSVFGANIERPKHGYIYTHIGFNHKQLESVFNSCQLKIIKKEYSPFKYFYNFINSQVFYILKKNNQ